MTNPTRSGGTLTGMLAAPHTLNFRAELEPGDDLGGDEIEEPDEQPGIREGEPTPGEPRDPDAPEEPEAPEAPAFDSAVFESPEFAQAVAEASQAHIDDLMARYEGQQGPEPAAQPGEPAPLPDPFEDPEGYADGMLGRIEQMLDQRLGPVHEIVQRQRGEEAQSYVSDIATSLPETGKIAELLPTPGEGEEDHRSEQAADLVEYFASGFLPAAEAQYGEGNPHAIQAALRHGAQQLQQTLKSVHDAGYAAGKGYVKTISGARGEPAGGGSAAEIDEVVGDEMAWADRVGDRFVTS